MLSNASEGSPGHGQVHPLPKGASVMGVAWDPMIPVWCRPGLPCLSNVARPIQLFRATVMGAWRDPISGALFKKEKVFVAVPLWMFVVPCSCLAHSMLRNVVRRCLGSVLVEAFGTDLKLERFEENLSHVAFVGSLTGMVIFSGSVPVLLWEGLLDAYLVLCRIGSSFCKIGTFGVKRAKICVKRFSLEGFCEKCPDMVMWTFSCCLRGSRKKFPTAQNRCFSCNKNGPKMSKNKHMQRRFWTTIFLILGNSCKT